MKIYLNPQFSESESLITQIFDIYQGIGKELNINLRVTKFDGLSQIIIENKLYLVGSGLKKFEANNFLSSHLIKIDFNDDSMPYIKILTSSEYPHYLPSLTKFKNEEIFVIGGKDNLTCEVFSLKSNKWKKLKNLPSERYGCSVVCDENNKFLYLFGGLNNSTNTINYSVLKYNLKSNIEWETLIVTSNATLLQRTFSGCFKTKNNSVILLGGSTNVHSETDDIIEYNILLKSASVFECKAKKPATFISSQYFEDDENDNYYGFDNDNVIHKVCMSSKETFDLKYEDYIISQYKMKEK